MMEVLLEKLTEKGDLKMKTRNKICLFGTLLLALIVAWNVYGVDAEVKESQSAEIQTSEQAGPDESATIPNLLREEYENWMEEAESSANGGYTSFLEAELTMARWCVEDANISEEVRTIMLKDFSEKAKATKLKGYRKAAFKELMTALRSAHSCYVSQTQASLKKYKVYCLKAGIEPNGKVKKVEEILAESLAEREKLSEK